MGWWRLALALLLSAPLLGCWDAGAQYGGNWRPDFSKHVLPLEEIVSGGPSKDGIPAIDDPKFISVREANCWLKDREPVMVVDLEGEVKAFPLQILIRSTTGLVAENAASSPISVRRKQHMYSIETPEAKPAPSTFRDPVIPESTDAQTGAAGDASGVTTTGSMVGDLLDSRLNNL